MNGNNNVDNNFLYNGSQISKNLPLKKRRTYVFDSSTADQEKYDNYSKMIKL